MKYNGLLFALLALFLTCTSFAQVSYDKVFVNNSAILNMIPTTSESHDYKDVILIASLPIETIGDYSSIIVEKVAYKEKFGSFSPTDNITKALIAINAENVFRMGRVQVKKETPKQICIYPEYSAGSVWESSGSSYSSLVIPLESQYVLVYNPSSAKNTFYMGNGSSLEGSYANLDGKGRITEIYYGGTYTLAGFHFQISYNDNGRISAVEKVETSKGSKGAINKKIKSSIKLSWKGNDLTRITIAPSEYESKEYSLEVKEKNADGLWTKAILSHKDDNSVGGQFIDCEYRRSFNK